MNFSNQSPLKFSTYNHTFDEKLSMKVTIYLLLPIDVVLMGPQTSETRNFQRLCCLPSSFIKKCNPMFFAFNAYYTKATRMSGKITCQGSYHSLCFGRYWHHVQMTKAAIPNSRTLSSIGDYTKLATSKPCTYTISFSYKFHSCGAIALASPSQDLIVHLFRLNWIFKPFDPSVLTKNNLACNLHTCNTYLIQIWLILPSKIASTTIDPIRISWTMLLLSKCTLHGVITSYVWNAVPCKVICFEAPEFMIYLHTLLECVSNHITIA